MKETIIGDLTHERLYRAVPEFGPMPLFPRHHSHFSCGWNGEEWFLVPLDTEEQIALTKAQGNNLSDKLEQFWKVYETRRHDDIQRPVFELIRAYLIHYFYAPCWTEAFDQWREANGMDAWGLWEVADRLAAAIVEVETPTELVEFVEWALREGFDGISPLTVQDLADLHGGQQVGG